MKGLQENRIKEKIQKLRRLTQNMNILMAEDYPVLHKSLKKLFTSLFKHVDSAYDGTEALNLYKQQLSEGLKYDILLSDIAMPNMDGVTLTKHIKQINSNQTIIIFSAYQDSSYLLNLINLGVRRFISKPISAANLVDELFIVCDTLHQDENLLNTVHLSQDILYDKDQNSIYVKGELLILTNYEQLIVRLLVSKLNLTVSNDEIVSYLFFHMIDIKIENIRKIMYKLRKKLPKEMITNIHSVGYRLVSKQSDK
ncbi:response regulator transcription factor [Sulfurimonas sp. HSL-1716]|uniref:response regulator transcription factor n=1 Tax=Hydrocurvibacter sulfurireducens TaxID=3131937 RepID=UPI0031F9AFC2